MLLIELYGYTLMIGQALVDVPLADLYGAIAHKPLGYGDMVYAGRLNCRYQLNTALGECVGNALSA